MCVHVRFCVCVGLGVAGTLIWMFPFQVLNQVLSFHGNWHECYATGSVFDCLFNVFLITYLLFKKEGDGTVYCFIPSERKHYTV
jgi:hypothetical protein